MINASSSLIIAAAVCSFSNMALSISCLTLGVVGSAISFCLRYAESQQKKAEELAGRENIKKVLSTFDGDNLL